MLRSLRTWLPGALVLCATPLLLAQEMADRYAVPRTAPSAQANRSYAPPREEQPAGPPAWQDGASAYLTNHDSAPESLHATEDKPTAMVDPRVSPAAHQSEPPHEPEPFPNERRLAPLNDATESNAGEESTAASGQPHWGLPMDSLYTTLAALALVVGLLLLCMWAMRRGAKGSAALLADDVVSVLGHKPLAGRQVAQLLRVGNKLVLISVTPAGSQPLAEITDPAEVERLLDLCLGRTSPRTTPDFDKTFRRLSREKTSLRVLGDEVTAASAPSVTDLFRAYQGEAERA
jgi:flagellar biogenesis protein FliO